MAGLLGAFRGAGAPRGRASAQKAAHTHTQCPYSGFAWGVAGVDRGDRGCQCSIGEGAKGVSAGDTPAPHNGLCLDGVGRLSRHGQAKPVVPRNAAAEPPEARLTEREAGIANCGVRLHPEAMPGASLHLGGLDPHPDAEELDLRHAMRRGSK